MSVVCKSNNRQYRVSVYTIFYSYLPVHGRIRHTKLINTICWSNADLFFAPSSFCVISLSCAKRRKLVVKATYPLWPLWAPVRQPSVVPPKCVLSFLDGWTGWSRLRYACLSGETTYFFRAFCRLHDLCSLPESHFATKFIDSTILTHFRHPLYITFHWPSLSCFLLNIFIITHRTHNLLVIIISNHLIAILNALDSCCRQPSMLHRSGGP